MAAQHNLGSVAEEGREGPKPANPNSVPASPIIQAITTITTVEMDIAKFGKIKVHIQGDLQKKNERAVFLTVHDIGTNHSSFRDFIEHPCMSDIKSKSIFIHLDLPGQSVGSPPLPDDFIYPTIQQLGQVLIPAVLDQLKVNLVVGIGEGAGANILVRFALTHPSRTLGLVLIHLVTASVGILAKLKESLKTGKRRQSEVSIQRPEQLVSLHKFGHKSTSPGGSGSASPDGDHPLAKENLDNKIQSINTNNLRKYVDAYMNRRDISDKLTHIRTLDCLLVVGAKSPAAKGVIQIHGRMDKSKTGLLKIDNAIDVMHEAPEKLAQSLLLFVKGLGFLTSLTLPGVERQRTFSGGSGSPGECPKQGVGSAPPNSKPLAAIGRRRTLSMEEYDLPRPRRLSLHQDNTGSNVSPAK